MREPTAIEEVAPGAWRVPLVTPTLFPATRTNTFVLDTEAGLVIVDPGASDPAELNRLLDFVRSLWSVDTVSSYVVTHHHIDHWGGLCWMLERAKAPVVAHDPARYNTVSATFRPTSWFHERFGGLGLEHTPGHASDHLVLRLPGERVIVGDLVAGVGTVVINPPDGSMSDYLAALRALLAKPLTSLFPAHGHTVDDGPAKLTEYIRHRLAREQQVLSTLKDIGPGPAESLVPSIYADVPVILHPVAARSVLAHLLKLEIDERVEREGEIWRSL